MNTSKNSLIQIISLSPPTLKNNAADADRLIEGLKAQLETPDPVQIDLDLLKKLPSTLRHAGYQVRCTLFRDRKRWHLTEISAANEPLPSAGLAVDLGTTRVALRLLDLAHGTTAGESSFDNPQIEVAPDILSRVHHTDRENGLENLRKQIITTINENLKALCNSCGMEPERIFAVSIAGNTTMTHLMMGLDPHWIIREPYTPVINRAQTMKASQLGLKVNPQARSLIFPNIGSYFGGDLIAGVLYSGIYKKETTSILVDVGTNAEVVLGNKNWLIGCAGAAGPALESGVSRIGMMAAPGVIDKLSVTPDAGEIHFRTIGNEPPKGICGSGVIDLGAQLFLAGMVDIQGKFEPRTCGDRLLDKEGAKSLIIVPAEKAAAGKDLLFSQMDLDSLIRSKAAMYAILETITTSVGITPSDLSTFYVAGTFGYFIDPISAISLGMLPDLPIDHYIPLGNSSLEGAAMALIDSSCMDVIDTIRDSITYLELNVNETFMNRFSAARFLPHTDRQRFPSVKIKNTPTTKL
jgi:uncharacterized 2Fe-2S/4Fe-4S cluster protein (DUF4445 family)